jgi:Protein of unknown function (DUF3025)
VGALPDHALLNAWARELSLALPDGRALTFVEPPARRPSALAYESRIVERAEIVTRAGNLHDLCNALGWLLLPRTKGALNAVHVNAERDGTPAIRGPARDAATLLDESGLLVACADVDLLERWRAHAWRDAFWERRVAGAIPLRAVVIGHGMLAKCVAPFRAITGRALVLPLAAATLPTDPFALAVALDTAAAAQVATWRPNFTARALLPLPIAALPGWDAEHLGRELFDDVAVFRPPRCREAGRIALLPHATPS